MAAERAGPSALHRVPLPARVVTEKVARSKLRTMLLNWSVKATELPLGERAALLGRLRKAQGPVPSMEIAAGALSASRFPATVVRLQNRGLGEGLAMVVALGVKDVLCEQDGDAEGLEARELEALKGAVMLPRGDADCEALTAVLALATGDAEPEALTDADPVGGRQLSTATLPAAPAPVVAPAPTNATVPKEAMLALTKEAPPPPPVGRPVAP